jgi:hypothetical protein
MYSHSLKKSGITAVIPNFRRFWLLFTYFAWFLLYYSFIIVSSDIVLTLAVIVIGALIIGIIQGIFANRLLTIIQYWIFVVLSGILAGLVWTILFVLTLVLLMANIAFIDLGDGTIQVLGSLTLIQLSYAIISLGFTYGFWYKIIKPIYYSPRLSDRQRLLYEGLITNAGSIYLAITIGFIFLLLFASNFTLSHVLGFLTSGWVFASLTYSGFQEIYEQNKFLKIFKEKSRKKTIVIEPETDTEPKKETETEIDSNVDPV